MRDAWSMTLLANNEFFAPNAKPFAYAQDFSTLLQLIIKKHRATPMNFWVAAEGKPHILMPCNSFELTEGMLRGRTGYVRIGQDVALYRIEKIDVVEPLDTLE